MTITKERQEIKDDDLHKYLIKKLKRAINDGQSILHISNKQNQITDLFQEENFYTKAENFDKTDQAKASYSQIILDLDMESLDNFSAALEICRKILFRHGHLIIIASNMCSFKNKVNFFFENRLEGLKRPNRAVTPGFLRQTLIESGFHLNNRGWQYEEKLLVICNP
mgnify:CR=1 FL=1|jgi:hypothetical protein